MVDKLRVLDKLLEFISENKSNSMSRRGVLALFATIGATCLITGCTKDEKYVDDYRDNYTEENANENTNTTDVQDIAEGVIEDYENGVPAAYEALAIIKETTEALKNSTEETRNTPEMDAMVRDAVQNFDVLYRFMMGEEFDTIPENDRIDMISATMSFTEIINTVEPNYKSDINDKYKDIKSKFSNFINEHQDEIDAIYQKAVDVTADGVDFVSGFIKDVNTARGK